MKQIICREHAALLLVAACVLLAPAMAAAQEFRGTILGRVTDAQRAVLPGVTVTVTNEGTSVASSAVSQADGAYTVPFLIPGSYRVEAELSGFQKLALGGIKVALGQRVMVNLQLQVGALSETVEVTGESPLIDTTSGGLGQIVDREQVEAMPLNGRMVFMLNRLASGVNWQVPTFGASGTSGLRPFDNSGGSAWSLNGGRVSTNEFLLDGAPDSTRGRYNFSPPVDAVDEFKIQTNTYDAQYGRTGGGVVNMTLKSGTNVLRGQVWEFMKNERLNANNALNVELGQDKPPYDAHQYGATVTGPIRKGKTFFMGTFEGLWERVPFPTKTSVPTEAERNGDFSQSYSDQGSPLVLYDPMTTRLVGNQYVRDPFPGNAIPANRINPVAKQLLALYPLPNVAGQRLNNYANTINPAKYDYDAELARFDHQFSAGNRMFVSLHRNHRDEYRSNNGLQGTLANQGQWPQTRENYGAIVDWVYTLDPKTILNLRGSYTHFTETQYQTDVEEYGRGTLGFQNLPGSYLPRIDLEQYTDFGVGNQGLNTSDKTTSAQANLTRMFSRHTVKAGAEYRHILAQPSNTGNANGLFGFTRAFTRRDPNSGDNTTGNSIASFLLGYPASGNIGAATERDELWHYVAAYIQGDIRLSRKLTVNLGLRYDYESGVVDSQDRLVRGFAFDQPSPIAASVKNAPGASECPACANLMGGMLFAGVDAQPRALFDPDRNNIQPRVGFAYALTDKTVVRGGYGIYYQFRTQLGSQTGFFVSTPYFANDINGRVGVPEVAANTFSNPFPNGLAVAPGASAGLSTQLGQSISFDDPTNKLPHIHHYNLTVSRQVARDLMVEVSYAGSRTHEISVGRNINAISAADLAKGSTYLQQVVTNPFAGLLPGSSRNGATIQRQQLLTPYPEFGSITRNAWSIGRVWYNSLQLLVQKRMSRGLALTSSYTYSKTMEQTSFLNDQDTEPVEQVADYDRPHLWTLSGIYELPFGNGKRFGGSATGLKEHLIGRWQIQWIFNWQSGRPLDQPGGLEPISSARLDHPTPERWFNTCYADLAGVPQKCLSGETPVWKQRPAFTLRTTPNRFSDIRVPWNPTLDMSLFKTIRFSPRWRLDLRFEAFNLMNTVIYPAPNTSYTSSDFGKIADPKGSVYFPRNVQVGMKLYF